MLPSFATQTVTRFRPAMIESRGSEIPDWKNVTEIDIPNCSIQPGTTLLSQDDRVLGISEAWTCYMPSSADVRAGDRIKFNGNVYTINGEPLTWPSASGRLDHIQLNLVRWYG